MFLIHTKYRFRIRYFWYTEKISIELSSLVFTNLQPSSGTFGWGFCTSYEEQTDPTDSDTCRWRHSDTWRCNGELQQIKAGMDISGVFEKTNVSEHHQPSISYSAQRFPTDPFRFEAPAAVAGALASI